MGSVIKMRMGLIMVLTIPIKRATQRAVQKLLMVIPGR